jgi:muramoyltetrapeptide carboxypeptidase
MKDFRTPESLKAGDEIRIVAPASIVETDYIEKSSGSLNDLGYVSTVGKSIFSAFNQFAGKDEERLSDFQEAIDNPKVKAIFCARGGYGSVRIIDKVDFRRFIKTPKWIVGFSDITVFHSWINTHYRISTLHSPMPINFDKPQFRDNLIKLNSILKGAKPEFEVKAHELNRHGICKGTLVGGNLSILYSLQATPYEINTKNKILFIEDVGEQFYHLDRMLNNLRLSGKLKYLRGLVVGGMTEMQDKKRPFGKTAYEIIQEAVRGYDYPVLFDFPAGHLDNNIPFILGAETELQVGISCAIIKQR